MPINKSKGNMYDFITHTWNAIKGKCPHGCTYCYMKRWGEQNPVRFDETEMKTNLGSGRYYFVGSSCDMFANDIPRLWINKTLDHCQKYPDNQYLFQSKNPHRMAMFLIPLAGKFEFAVDTTIETNRSYPNIMMNSPTVWERAKWIRMLKVLAQVPAYITIEPVMDFDIVSMTMIIYRIRPDKVIIGADSGNNGLPEPSREKLLTFINNINSLTTIKKKSNLDRLLKE